MTYWEYSAAVTVLNVDSDDAVEPPTYEQFDSTMAAIMANPNMVN